jgi:hypothetical protein
MSRKWFPQAKPSRIGRRPGSEQGGEYVVGWRGRPPTPSGAVGWYEGIGTYDEVLRKCAAFDAENKLREHYPQPFDSIHTAKDTEN